VSTRRLAPGGETRGIEAVLRGVRAQPAHGRLAVFDLRREERFGTHPVLDGRYGVAFRGKPGGLTLLSQTVVVAPRSAEDPNYNGKLSLPLARQEQVESQFLCANRGKREALLHADFRWNGLRPGSSGRSLRGLTNRGERTEEERHQDPSDFHIRPTIIGCCRR
jgi:hypothetical protein